MPESWSLNSKRSDSKSTWRTLRNALFSPQPGQARDRPVQALRATPRSGQLEPARWRRARRARPRCPRVAGRTPTAARCARWQQSGSGRSERSEWCSSSNSEVLARLPQPLQTRSELGWVSAEGDAARAYDRSKRRGGLSPRIWNTPASFASTDGAPGRCCCRDSVVIERECALPSSGQSCPASGGGIDRAGAMELEQVSRVGRGMAQSCG
jgi:hypothetical protein